MRCRKPCQRWSMKSLTIPPRLTFAQGLKHRDSLQQHHPKRQCGLSGGFSIIQFRGSMAGCSAGVR